MDTMSLHTAIVICLCATLADTNLVASSAWEVVREEYSIVYDTQTTGRSAVECAIHCRRSKDCLMAAYQASSQSCFLRLSNVLTFEGAQSVTTQTSFYNNELFGCKISEAGSFVNGSITAWRTSMTSVEGDVMCLQDFMYSAWDSPRVWCEAGSGRWESTGSCMQTIWTNNTVALSTVYRLPRSPFTGWSMCLTATTTSETDRFQIDLEKENGDQPLHISARMLLGDWVKTTVLSSKVGDTYGPDPVQLSDPENPFPFANNVIFTMRITATNSTTFQVYVDGGLYGTRVSP